MSIADQTIIIQEVAPRDGLQIEPQWVETADKVKLINRLSAAGFSRIEAGSFVSPKAVPALRDSGDVFNRIERRPGTIYVALVPNRIGAERAILAKADELNFVLSASDTHNLANMGMTSELSLLQLQQVMQVARSGDTKVNATIATAFGCPFEGRQDPDKIMRLLDRYLALGVDGVTLADTTGMANPVQASHLTSLALSRLPAEKLTLHFHNTRGLGLANIIACYAAGGRRFDAALGGLGGCPFAPGATGNVCTEDLVNLCHETDIHTGLDLDALIALARELPALVGHDIAGQVAKAGRACDLHPIPERVGRALRAAGSA